MCDDFLLKTVVIEIKNNEIDFSNKLGRNRAGHIINSFDDKMKMEEKFETIEEFARLSPQDKGLVLEQYRKDEHPYQTEYQIWAIFIPSVLFGVAEFIFKDKMEFTYVEMLSLLIVAIVFFYLTCRFIELNFVAPKVIKKIIDNLDEIKKSIEPIAGADGDNLDGFS